MGGLCVSALVMGACFGGDKTPAEEITVDAETLNLSKADENALSRHFEIDRRDGTEVETLRLLDALGFGNAVYETRQIEGSIAVFTGWAANGDDGAIKADRVEMIGVHDTEMGPTLDKLVVLDMDLEGYDEASADDPTEDVRATIGKLTVVKPDPYLMADLSDVMMARNDGSDAAVETVGDIGEGNGFQAFRIEDMNATVQEDGRIGTLGVEQIIVGQDPDEETLDAVLETVDFRWVSEDADDPFEPFSLDMDGLTVMGLNTDRMERLFPQRLGAVSGVMAGALNTLTPSEEPPYRQIDLGKFSLVSSVFDLTTDGFEADTDQQGDVIILRTVTEPLLFRFKDVSTTALAPYMDALKNNGFDEISFKGSSVTRFETKADRVVFDDNGTEIDEGLRIKCQYALQGLRAAADSLEASNVTPPVFELDGDGDTQAAMERFAAQSERFQQAQSDANAKIKLEGLTCDIQDVADNSFVERAYAVASAITGRSVPVLKGGAKTAIALGSLTAQTEFERDLMDIVGSGLIDFIDEPGQTLTIVIAPDAPVSIASLTGQNGNQPTIKPLNMTVDVR